MNLPPLSIPDVSFPFIIPEMVHPLFVHFAIALPVVILLFELVNLFLKRRAVGVSSFLLLLLMVVVYMGAYLTGVTDGKEAAKVLSPEAKDLLATHKQLGIYLVYGTWVVVLFKLISVVIPRIAARLIFLLVLILFIVTAFNEGKKGGELVYRHGANVQAVAHKAPAAETAKPENSETDDEASAPEKAAASVKEAVENVTESAKAAGAETVEKAKKAVKETAAETVEKAKEAVEKSAKPAQEAPAEKITPVEAIPAG